MGDNRSLLVLPELLEHIGADLVVHVLVRNVAAKRRIDLHYGGVLQPVGVRGIVGRAQPDIIVVRVFAHMHYPNDNRMLFGVDAARVNAARSQYEAGKKSVVLCLDFTWRGNKGRWRGCWRIFFH